MNNWNQLIQAMKHDNLSHIDEERVKIYPKSFTSHGQVKLLMAKIDAEKVIVATGQGELFEELEGKCSEDFKVCPLSHNNRLVLNRYFKYTAPRAFGKQMATIGLGDRLGLASPGHIRTVEGRNIRPILAQQSIRELNLTGRTYEEVLDAACFAVFQEGYKDGFGADGDHLKREEDIQMALDLGFTMLTLDCSDNIDNTIEDMDTSSVEEKYNSLPDEVRNHCEQAYEDRSFEVRGTTIHFDKASVMKNALIYGEAIGFMKYIYSKYLQGLERKIDFEISIDETLTPTAPESHYFVAGELYSAGIDVFSIAPRFCGEFQKGIDYIGDLDQFEHELKIHTAIADHFGYKLSIHSGSDKFSVFSMIGEHTRGRFHVKTAGTNWLEAVRTIAKVHPDLYRRMHRYALEHFEEAKAYYHVTTEIDVIRSLDQVSDEELPRYMDDNNARQLIHITYGILLQAKDGNGKSLFKEEFYRTLIEQEEMYEAALQCHIGKHLELLGK